jgi:hypothetical protein
MSSITRLVRCAAATAKMRAALAALLLVLPAAAAAQQQILLDKPVRAGELIVFPDLSDASAYYYVVDKPRLATDANGRPQFSFLRYVENVRGTGGADAPTEGDGGGIVHAVVALTVSREQIQAAQRELQRIRPGAQIKGPVMFKSGKFGLVTSFKDPQGKLATQVVGLGNAPLLDGEKAAVSMQLTKQGAKLLWESFNTAAPDISFTFEMEVSGYSSPKQAVIEANFDQIYEHQTFNAGLASQYLAAEIRLAFEDLTRSGAIKVTNIGADQQMESLINTAYTKITEMMFSPLNGSGTPSLSSLTTAGAGNTSLLDRATTMLANNRQETRTENERIRRENREAEDRARREREARSQPGTEGTRREGETPRPNGDGARPPEGSNGATGANGDGPHVSASARDEGAAPPTDDPRRAGRMSHDEATKHEAESAKPQEEQPLQSFAIVAAYEMKRVRQRGNFRIDLNKYTADSLTLRFDENIGDLSAVRSDTRHFREINMDDPLFRQREITVMVDGLNAQDFGQYINFVTVQMRKKHAAGAETLDDVRIDRKNFNTEGNKFGFVYGWKDDNDRRRWMEYEYRPVWSFFGGVPVEGTWTSSTAGALTMMPPFQRRSVELQAAPEAVTQHGIRAITVRVFYTLGGVEKSKSVTLNASKNQLSEKIEFMLPNDVADYAYEITWQLTGNRTRSSGRQTGNSAVLFVDEVPAS